MRKKKDRNAFGALIDMDGVLYDSMPLHTLAWKQMMQGVGVDTDRDEFYLYEGMTGRATINLLFQRAFGHGVSPEEADRMYQIKSELFKAMGGAQVMPGAQRMIEQLGRLGFHRVLVTGSSQASILDKLQTDYPGVFSKQDRVTAKDVTYGKPDPEPYLMGAQKADALPADCIVVENAPLGVRAGKKAGCRVIAVMTGPIPRAEFEKEGADIIFESMPDFADFLESLDSPEQLFGWEYNLSVLLKKSTGAKHECDKVIILTDSNVRPLIGDIDYPILEIPAGEQSKNIDTLALILSRLNQLGATRQSVLVNIGGGVVSDIGGLAAGLYMRGMRHINVPTTLLAMADAAIGGKTAIDFNGIKNLVGMFKMPLGVITDTQWLHSLSPSLLIDGLAEVVKSSMLDSAGWYADILKLPAEFDARQVRTHALRAARFKQDIVEKDPTDKGLRHILNFGHTAGHAYEALAAAKGIALSHGEAVAHGILVALWISNKLLGFDVNLIIQYRDNFLKKHYRPLPEEIMDIDELISLMAKDKKNKRHGDVQFVLLRYFGEPVASMSVSSELIREALNACGAGWR